MMESDERGSNMDSDEAFDNGRYTVVGVMIAVIGFIFLTQLAPLIWRTGVETTAPWAENTMLIVVPTRQLGNKRLIVESFYKRVANHVFICEEDEQFENYAKRHNACRKAATSKLPPQVRWVVLAEADYTAEVRTIDMKTPPLYDVNYIQLHSSAIMNPVAALVRADVYRDHCRYRLWAHDYLECADAGITFGNYHGFYIRRSPAHLVDHDTDIRLLESWIRTYNGTQEAVELLGRALFFLAQSYEASGQLERALKTYECHNKEQKFTNYLFYAHYRMAMIRSDHFLNAHAQLDGYFRREPLFQLAILNRAKRNWAQCLVYATAALGMPAVDQARMPLYLETALYEAGDANPALQAWRYCAEQLKVSSL